MDTMGPTKNVLSSNYQGVLVLGQFGNPEWVCMCGLCKLSHLWGPVCKVLHILMYF